MLMQISKPQFQTLFHSQAQKLVMGFLILHFEPYLYFWKPDPLLKALPSLVEKNISGINHSLKQITTEIMKVKKKILINLRTLGRIPNNRRFSMFKARCCDESQSYQASTIKTSSILRTPDSTAQQ
jgi:hypothetical protein